MANMITRLGLLLHHRQLPINGLDHSRRARVQYLLIISFTIQRACVSGVWLRSTSHQLQLPQVLTQKSMATA